jgi:isopentenyl diphosphate isomerase/L-lactate dehydrogenase-like FMN-dependent dehydrogenase
LAIAGEEGVDAVLNELWDELKIAMGLCGIPDVRHVPADLLAPVRL